MPDFSPLVGANAKVLWALLAVVAADMIAGSIASPFLPLFIQQISPDSAHVASNTGLILGLGAIMSAAAAVIVGKFSYRLGYQRVLVVCLIGAAVFTVPQAFARSPGALLALRLASSFFIGGDMPAVNALITARTESGKQGSVYGLRTTVSSASGALGPAIGTAASIALAAGSTARSSSRRAPYWPRRASLRSFSRGTPAPDRDWQLQREAAARPPRAVVSFIRAFEADIAAQAPSLAPGDE